MSFVKTKGEANQKRREIKKIGRCSCYVHTREGIYYVSDCPLSSIQFCKPRKTE
jgi:hypothetical protein